MPRRISAVGEDTIINRLLDGGYIRRTERRGVYETVLGLLRRPDILRQYCVEVEEGRYTLQPMNYSPSRLETQNGPQPVATPTPAAPLRTIHRYRYHSQDRNITNALERIARDADGVRRSYGLEWEIYSLTTNEEHKLAQLLDTLPPHTTEADASLSSSGVEIVFEPMGKQAYITTFKALQAFTTENAISMSNTGAHTTYGVSNSTTHPQDLQIRLNRLALAVKSVGTQRAIRKLFGRDFSSYCSLPTSTTTSHHSNAFSASRGTSAWECRLINWEADVNKVIDFLAATEFAFQRPVQAQDFMKVFKALGSDTDGE